MPRGIRTLTNEQSERLQREGHFHYSPDNCVTCRGRKRFEWWSDDDRTEVVTYECSCIDQYLLHRYLLWSGLGRKDQRLAWADFEHDNNTIKTIKSLLDSTDDLIDKGLGVILHGTFGTGKTMLAVLMLKHCLASGYEGYFTTFSNLIEMFTSGWRSSTEREQFHRRIRNSSFLVVDDLGKERKYIKSAGAADSTSLVESLIDEVLRWRVANGLPTIITTNFDPEDDDFGHKYGVGVMSLLSESSYIQPLMGDDFRARQRARSQEELLQGLTRPIVIG